MKHPALQATQQTAALATAGRLLAAARHDAVLERSGTTTAAIHGSSVCRQGPSLGPRGGRSRTARERLNSSSLARLFGAATLMSFALAGCSSASSSSAPSHSTSSSVRAAATPLTPAQQREERENDARVSREEQASRASSSEQPPVSSAQPTENLLHYTEPSGLTWNVEVTGVSIAKFGSGPGRELEVFARVEDTSDQEAGNQVVDELVVATKQSQVATPEENVPCENGYCYENLTSDHGEHGEANHWSPGQSENVTYVAPALPNEHADYGVKPGTPAQEDIVIYGCPHGVPEKRVGAEKINVSACTQRMWP